MATMRQEGMATREFAQEFEQHARDAGMAEEDAKVHLVLFFNQNTLPHLDAYITMRSGEETAHLETIQDQLCHILYIQMLAYLK